MTTAAACPNSSRPEILGVLAVSNIFVTAKELCQTSEGPWARRSLRLHFDHLAGLIRAGRPGTIFAACAARNGAQGLIASANRAGIDLRVFEQGAETGREIAVDQTLQADLRGRLLDSHPGVPLVLVTGDGAGHGIGEGFRVDVGRAVRQGRAVELLAFAGSCNRELRASVERYQHGLFMDLTPYYRAITFIDQQRRADPLSLTRRPRPAVDPPNTAA